MNNPQGQLYQTREVQTSKGAVLQAANFAALSRDCTRTTYTAPVFTPIGIGHPSTMQIQTLPSFPYNPQRGPVTYTFQSIPQPISYGAYPYVSPNVTVPVNVQSCNCYRPAEPMEVDELEDISTSMRGLSIHQGCRVCAKPQPPVDACTSTFAVHQCCDICNKPQTTVDVCTSTDSVHQGCTICNKPLPTVDVCTSTCDLWAQSLRCNTSNSTLARKSLAAIKEEVAIDCSTSTTDLEPQTQTVSPSDPQETESSPEPTQDAATVLHTAETSTTDLKDAREPDVTQTNSVSDSQKTESFSQPQSEPTQDTPRNTYPVAEQNSTNEHSRSPEAQSKH